MGLILARSADIHHPVAFPGAGSAAARGVGHPSWPVRAGTVGRNLSDSAGGLQVKPA